MRKLTDDAKTDTAVMISDFTSPLFQSAFKTYFAELGISVKDWDGLFREMNDEGGNMAFVRTAGDGEIF